MRGTGSHRQAQAEEAGRVKVVSHAGQGQQVGLPCQAGAPGLFAQGLAVEGEAGEAFEVAHQVEVGNRRANHGAHPFVKREFVSVAGVEVLPDLHLGGFRVEDETVKVKD